MRKKISLIICIVLLLFFQTSCRSGCGNHEQILPKYDFNGMTYGIFLSSSDRSLVNVPIDLKSELDPFDGNYFYSDKAQRQAYIREVEKMYNIKIEFDISPSDENCYVTAWNTYPILNISHTDRVSYNYAYPLYSFESKKGILKDTEYLNDPLKVEMGSVKDNIYIYYPGDIYSYNFLYYNGQKDFGNYNPLELYEKGEWNLNNYKYVLANYCDNSVNSLNELDITGEQSYYIGTMPSKLSQGIAAANGYHILNKNGYMGNNVYVNDIFNESIDLFNNYYKYDLNNVKKIFDPISFPTIDQKSLSSFILDNTVISAGKLDFLKKDSSLLSNDVKWQLIPYPSSNYDNYKSYVDGFNQLGFTIVGDYNYNGEDVSSFNEEFTREIAFEILYDLFDGYYHKFPIAQENNIKEYLEKHLTKESIDLFFKFNRNVSFEATNVLSTLYSASSYGKEHYDNNQIEKLFSSASVSLDSFLLMNESFIETYFLKNLSYNNHVVLNNKFNYTLKVKYENNYCEMSIHELYEELYDGLMKSNR